MQNPQGDDLGDEVIKGPECQAREDTVEPSQASEDSGVSMVLGKFRFQEEGVRNRVFNRLLPAWAP